jgi:hypothetical protein
VGNICLTQRGIFRTGGDICCEIDKLANIPNLLLLSIQYLGFAVIMLLIIYPIVIRNRDKIFSKQSGKFAISFLNK